MSDWGKGQIIPFALTAAVIAALAGCGSGSSGSAVNTGSSGSAVNTGSSGSAVNTGSSGSAVNTDSSGSAANTDSSTESSVAATHVITGDYFIASGYAYGSGGPVYTAASIAATMAANQQNQNKDHACTNALNAESATEPTGDQYSPTPTAQTVTTDPPICDSPGTPVPDPVLQVPQPCEDQPNVAGTQVTITDPSGKIIGVGTLSEGQLNQADACDMTFTVPGVADAAFYQVTIGYLNAVTFSSAEMVNDGYAIGINNN